MATSVLQPQAVPEPTYQEPIRSGPMTVVEEVVAAHNLLRSRLEGALNGPPPGVKEEDLPTVPLIDLASSLNGSTEEKKAVAAQIHEACVTTGFFQIKNHGITLNATDGVLEQAKRFFRDLTPEQKDKLHCRHSALFRGYEPGDYTYVNPDDLTDSKEKAAPEHETKEAFNWGYEPALDPTGGDGGYVELDGTPPRPGHTNVWPTEEELPGFTEAIKEYYVQAMTLCRHLFGLFALSLGLEESYFDQLLTHPGGIARLIHYPPQPEAEMHEKTDTRLGLGAHTDYECFTLLLCSSNPGLEILFPPTPQTNGRSIWRPCPVREGTITVNVADFLQRWTNELYKSTIHRVMSKMGGQERYSVPLFFSVNYDAEIKPLPESAVGKSKFEPLKVGEYVLERLKATKSNGEGEDDVSKATM